MFAESVGEKYKVEQQPPDQAISRNRTPVFIPTPGPVEGQTFGQDVLQILKHPADCSRTSRGSTVTAVLLRQSCSMNSASARLCAGTSIIGELSLMFL